MNMSNPRFILGFINLLLGSVNLGIYIMNYEISANYAIIGSFGVFSGLLSLYYGFKRI